MRIVLAAGAAVAVSLLQLVPSPTAYHLPPTPVALAAPSPPGPRAPGASPAPSSDLPGDPVVVVVLDGVRWQEIFHGVDPVLAKGTPLSPGRPEELTPHLHQLMAKDGAVIGAPGRGTLSASGPSYVSLPAYREIFSGQSQPECQDNECGWITQRTLVDELRDAGREAAVFASWEKIDRAAAGRSSGVRIDVGRGALDVDPWPGSGDFRPDRLTVDAALGHLEHARPDFLFLGLGEPDEYAHRGDYVGYVGSLSAADRALARLGETLDRMGARGRRTHVFVTADHGRADSFRDHGRRHPESGRVWMVATGPRITARGPVRSAEPRHLRDLAPTARALLGLESPSPAAPGAVGGARLRELDLEPSR